MIKVLVCSLFVSLSAFAVNTWNDLEVSENYKLTQPLSLDSSWIIPTETSFSFEDLIPTDIYLQLRFRQIECLYPEKVSELVLYNPSPEDPYFDRSIGLQMEEGCLLNIYLEPSDYYSPSVF